MPIAQRWFGNLGAPALGQSRAAPSAASAQANDDDHKG